MSIESCNKNNSFVLMRGGGRLLLLRGKVARFFLGTTYQNGQKTPNDHRYTNRPRKIPNHCKIDQTPIKYTNIFHLNTVQKLPELGFLV
jgi:hypothetical protein